jgi:phosphatidylinositol 3-kinase
MSTPFAVDPHFWAAIDPDVTRENPVEDKHRRLVRSHRSSPYDRELKPNAKIRDDLGVRPLLIMSLNELTVTVPS